MLSLAEILTLAFIRMWSAHMDELKIRYKHKTWFKIITSYTEDELNDAIGKIMKSGQMDEAYTKSFTDSEMLELVCDLKNHFAPADFLFLKATFTDDDKDRIFFLEQAQMICPENIRIQAMKCYVIADAEEEPDEEIAGLNTLVEHTHDIDVREYVRLGEIIRALANADPDCRPGELTQFLNKSSFTVKAKLSLLHAIVEHSDAEDMKVLLHHLRIPGCKENWMYQLAKLNTCLRLEDYENARYWYERVRTNPDLPYHPYEVELSYKQVILLRETGNKGRAILLLREIVFSGEFEESYCDYYFQAIADLTEYYVSQEQPEEAERVLKTLPPALMEYMEDFSGEDFLITLADKAILEDNVAKALIYYKKAFQLNTNPDIAEKIRMLGDNI